MNEDEKKLHEEQIVPTEQIIPAEQAPNIEVDVTKEPVTQGTEVNKDIQNAREELPAEQIKQEPEEDVKDTQANSEDETEDTKTPEKHGADKTVEADEPTEASEADEVSEDKVEEVEDKEAPAEELEELTDKEKELQAKLNELEADKIDADNIQELALLEQQAQAHLNQVAANVKDALLKTIEKYDIPKDKSLNELKELDPAKASVLESVLISAKQVIEQETEKANQVVQAKAQDALFVKAGRMLDKFDMTPEQQEVAADMFIEIMNRVGFDDLGEDLKAKVELCVAKAKMVSPDKIESSKKEEKEETVEEVLDKAIVNSERNADSEKSEKKELPPTKPDSPVEPVKPDLSEFKEGVMGGATTSTAVTEDNVLQQMAALPFKDRTAFYKEHLDLINKAMAKKR